MKTKENLEIVQKHKIWFVISLGIITAGIIMFTIFAAIGGINKGLNLGTDFTGGTQLNIETGSVMNDDNRKEIKKVILDTLNEFGIKNKYNIRLTGDNEGYTIVYRDTLTNEKVESLEKKLIEKINSVEQNSLVYVNSQSITAKAGSSASFYILLFVLAAWLLIVAYIAFRFELSSALAAFMGLIHDVLIVFALAAICRIQINIAFFGALIAVICYSLYNTIIVFDKTREIARREAGKDSTAADIVNKSVTEIVRRILFTTIVISIMLLSLIITGVPSIIVSAFFVILGLITGTYSSLFVVPSAWALYKARQKDKKGKIEYFKKKVLFKRTEKTESSLMENQTDE